jgi:hypothetical protein
MATVLVAVALLAASIWIAIRMESGLDIAVRQAPPADTGTVRPARCRFRPRAGLPAARPVRCTQRSPQVRAGAERVSQAPAPRVTACSRPGAPHAGSTRKSPVSR